MIVFNGITSDSIGVIVERIPNRFVPARRIAAYEVAGRNGNAIITDKSYPNIEQRYAVYLSAESVGLPRVAHDCAAWLCSPAGYAVLSDDYDTDGYREAYLAEGFDIENILNEFGRAEIVFNCKPQYFLHVGTASIDLTGLQNIENPTVFDAYPLLTVKGTGTITLNGFVINVLQNDGTLVIDCAEVEAYTNGVATNTYISCLERPYLQGGVNAISHDSGITSLLCVPRWWKL